MATHRRPPRYPRGPGTHSGAVFLQVATHLNLSLVNTRLSNVTTRLRHLPLGNEKWNWDKICAVTLLYSNLWELKCVINEWTESAMFDYIRARKYTCNNHLFNQPGKIVTQQDGFWTQNVKLMSSVRSTSPCNRWTGRRAQCEWLFAGPDATREIFVQVGNPNLY
jgi:hypothetical protein